MSLVQAAFLFSVWQASHFGAFGYREKHDLSMVAETTSEGDASANATSHDDASETASSDDHPWFTSCQTDGWWSVLPVPAAEALKRLPPGYTLDHSHGLNIPPGTHPVFLALNSQNACYLKNAGIIKMPQYLETIVHVPWVIDPTLGGPVIYKPTMLLSNPMMQVSVQTVYGLNAQTATMSWSGGKYSVVAAGQGPIQGSLQSHGAWKAFKDSPQFQNTLGRLNALPWIVPGHPPTFPTGCAWNTFNWDNPKHHGIRPVNLEIDFEGVRYTTDGSMSFEVSMDLFVGQGTACPHMR